MPETTLKPITTIYNGYRFRSRLEARWAVFFDHAEIRFEYEKEGYDLGDLGWYLPDFWLPEQGCWIEIKSRDASDDDIRGANTKMLALAKMTGHCGYVIYGLPQCPYKQPGGYETYCLFPDGKIGWMHLWAECRCGWVEMSYYGDISNLQCGCELHVFRGWPGHDTLRICNAYAAATSARFEHGEKG